MIFVRHGRALVQPDQPTNDWPLDPEHAHEVVALRVVLPGLPIVCSNMRRAIETATLLGEPTVDPRLDEVSRPWTDDLEDAIARYFAGVALDAKRFWARLRNPDAWDFRNGAFTRLVGT